MKVAYTLCLAVAVLAGCATNGSVPSPSAGAEADAAAADCIKSVTQARKAATALLRAGKISLERDVQLQDGLNTMREGCAELAKGTP